MQVPVPVDNEKPSSDVPLREITSGPHLNPKLYSKNAKIVAEGEKHEGMRGEGNAGEEVR
jgi:hypothetical protein